MNDSIENVFRQLISREIERTRAQDPLIQAVRDLTVQVGELVQVLGASPPPRPAAVSSAGRDADALQAAHRPEDVQVLFVTSRTAIATPDASFYLANSHLFRCVRAAFVEAFGTAVPNGEAFLDFFHDSRCWMVILPDELRRGRGRPPRRVLPDTSYLVEIIKATAPDFVVGARRAVARPLIEAVEATGMGKDRLVIVRTPRELWKPQFVGRLKKMLTAERLSVTN